MKWVNLSTKRRLSLINVNEPFLGFLVTNFHKHSHMLMFSVTLSLVFKQPGKSVLAQRTYLCARQSHEEKTRLN